MNDRGHDDGDEPSAKVSTKGHDVGEVPRAQKTRTGIIFLLIKTRLSVLHFKSTLQ